MAFVAIDLRVHESEPSVVDWNPRPLSLWRAISESDEPAYRLVGEACAGRQVLTFVETSELDALLGLVRDITPDAGIEQVTALIWEDDPRTATEPPVRRIIHSGQAPPEHNFAQPGLKSLISMSEGTPGSQN